MAISGLMRFLSGKRRVFAVVGLSMAAGVLGVVAFLKIDAVRERSRVTQLTDIEQLKEAFNDDAGSVRLIVLLSPT